MTTATYLVLAELAEKVLTMSDLASLGVQTTLKFGGHLVHYAPRADQPLSPDHPIEAFADKQPANDNEPAEDVSPATPEPATASTKTAVLDKVMQRAHEMPGVRRVLHREVVFESEFGHLDGQAANAPTPFTGRSRLKAMDFNQSIPISVSIASRPYVNDLLSHCPRLAVNN